MSAAHCDSNAERYPDGARVAVGAVVFKDGAVLLVRRGKAPNHGLWAVPGGSVRLGETLQQAAERELLEETSIRVRAGLPIYIFDVIERDSDGRIRYHYVIADLLAEYVEGWPQANDDALEARWIMPDELQTLPVSKTTVELLQSKFAFGLNINDD
jgi:ADP-ribose pyrophosphatase